MSSKQPLTIFRGQRAAIRLVGRSYGQQRPSLVDGIDWTPNIDSMTILEFDNLLAALIYTSFNDVSGKMSYKQSNQMGIEAILMDQNPTGDELMVDPTGLVPFVAYANLKGEDGRIKGAYLLRGVVPQGNPFTSTVKEGATRSIDFKALNAHYFHGLQINYQRLRGALTIQDPPAQPTLAQAAVGGFLGPDTYYVQTTAVTASGETIASNEASIQIIAATTNKITVTTPAIVAPVTAYNIFISNRSNGEIFSAQVSAGTTTDILQLPATNAARPPIQNTSGVPAVTGDKVLTLAAGLYSATLDIAAFKLPQTGLDYVLVHKNGSPIANVNNPASEDTFAFNAGGTVFSVLDASGDSSWYDVWTLSKPTPN